MNKNQPTKNVSASQQNNLISPQREGSWYSWENVESVELTPDPPTAHEMEHALLKAGFWIVASHPEATVWGDPRDNSRYISTEAAYKMGITGEWDEYDCPPYGIDHKPDVDPEAATETWDIGSL